MTGIMDEHESMALREPDHAAIGSQDLGKQPFEAEFPCTPHKKGHEAMRYLGSMPLIRDQYGQLAGFLVGADYKRGRGDLDVDTILLGNGDEATTSCGVRIAGPDQVVPGKLRVPPPEAEIPRAHRKPFQILRHAIHVVVSDRPYVNQMPCFCRPALAYMGRERRRQCGIMHVLGWLMDVSAGFYRVPRASERILHQRMVATRK